MKRNVVKGLLVLCALLVNTVHAARQDDINQILTNRNDQQAFQSYTAFMSSGVDEQFAGDGELNEAQLNKLQQSFKQHINSELFLNKARASLSVLEQEAVDRLLQWQASELGKRIIAAETAFPVHQRDAMYKGAFTKAKPERQEVIQQISSVFNYVEDDALVQKEVMRIDLRRNPESAVTPEEFDYLFNRLAVGFKQEIRFVLLEMIAQRYQSFTLDELKQYYEFLNTEAFQKFHKIITAARLELYREGLPKHVDDYLAIQSRQ